MKIFEWKTDKLDKFSKQVKKEELNSEIDKLEIIR